MSPIEYINFLYGKNDFSIICETELVQGLPAYIVSKYPGTILLKFDLAYHEQHKMQTDGPEPGLGIILSFDTLYNCFIPEAAIRGVIVRWSGEEVKPQVEPEKPRGSHLSVVK